MLSWYELPIICHENTFNSFLNTIEENGIENALIRYKSDIQWISILSRKPMSNQTILKIVEEFIDLNDGTTDVSYYSEYPIQPLKRTAQLLKLPDSDYYLRVMTNVQISESKVYLKGIHISNESITLPYAIAGIDIERIFLNICSGNYDTDVARNSFDAQSRKKLETKVAKLIYGDIMQSVNFNTFEKLLIKQFLKTYYN